MKKNLKWILLGAGVLILAAALILTLSFCGKDPGAAAPDDPAAAPTVGAMTDYVVQITNEEGTPLEGIGVYIYQDESQSELTWFDKTDSNGQITFSDLARETYVAVLKDIPTGYEADEMYPLTGATTQIVLKVGVMTEEDMANLRYMLGDKMMDFTVIDTDGKSHTLSELLKTKKAVVLNFWYTNCEPCKLEFPYLSEAYKTYSKDIEVLAMNPVDSDAAAVAQFKADNGLPFPVIVADPAWQNMMQITGYPTTVVIDRYGNISLIHKGGIESTYTFEQIFAYFTANDYVSTPIKSIDQIVEEQPVGTKENPFETGSFKKLEITVQPGETYYLRLYKQVTKWYLSIEGKDCDGDFTLMYKEKEYDDEDGELTIQIKPDGAFVPVELAITNNSDEEQTYVLSRSTAKGSYDNPYKLKLGEFEAKVAAGNDQGIYYTYTAEQSGELRITCLRSSVGDEFGLTLYNLDSYAMRNWDSDINTRDEDGNPYVAVKAKKGQKIQFILNTEPNDSNKYPAGNFTLLAEFTEGDGEYITIDNLPKTTYTITAVDQKNAPVSGLVIDFTGDFTYVLETEDTAATAAETEDTTTGDGTTGDGTTGDGTTGDGTTGDGTTGDGTTENPTQFHIRVNQVLTTDEKGVATTQQVTGPYTASIRIPEGYSLETSQYELTAEAPELTVNLHRIIISQYSFTLTYPDGTPITGMPVMLGSDMKTTNANGTVTFEKEEGQYTLTVVGTLPEGYVLPGGTNTVTFPEGKTSMTVALVSVGGQENPYAIDQFPFTTKTLGFGETVYANITAQIGYADSPVLTVKDEDAVITYNGADHAANEAGIVEIPLVQGASSLIAIKNNGFGTKALTLEMVYPVGCQSNPQVITDLADISVILEENDQDGYYLQYIPKNTGDVTFTVGSVTPANAGYEATITSETSGTVSFQNGTAAAYVKKGEAAVIFVRAQAVGQTTTPTLPALELTMSGVFKLDEDAIDESPTDYLVTVTDYDGNPITGAGVQFMLEGSAVHTGLTDANGQISAQLNKAVYQVVIAAEGYYYDSNMAALSETVTELTVKMTANKASTDKVTEEDTMVVGAISMIEVGQTYIELPSADSYKYFAFCPGVAGTYRFTTSNPAVQPSYWLTQSYVMEATGYYVADGNYIDISIDDNQTGIIHIVGFKGAKEAVVTVQRVGDAAWSIQNEPYDTEWMDLYAYHEPSKVSFKTADLDKLTYVDLNDATKYYNLVLGEDDFYHLNTADGPLLYINFGYDAPLACIYEKMHGNGTYGGRGLGRTFWKDSTAGLTQDNFLKKESYTDRMDLYINNGYDPDGGKDYILYPLTEDIAYAVVNGCYDMWEDPNNLLYENFSTAVESRAWMFAVCYVDTGDIDLSTPPVATLSLLDEEAAMPPEKEELVPSETEEKKIDPDDIRKKILESLGK